MTAFFYLSFASGEFLGGAIVPGATLIEAVGNASAAGCNPGGEVLGCQIPREHLTPKVLRNVGRLLSKGDLDGIWSDMRSTREYPVNPPPENVLEEEKNR